MSNLAHNTPIASSDSSKENRPMSKRLASLAALIGTTALLLALLPIASASAAEPWWQLLDGSRPSNLWEASDSVQEIETAKKEVLGAEALLAEVKVDGEVLGCLTAGEYFGFPASFVCAVFFGMTPIESAAELEAALETPYGAGEVEVTGGPAGGEPFIVTVAGRPVSPVQVSPLASEAGPLGSATAKVLSVGGSGGLVITATNLGDAPLDATTEAVVIKDQLPEGVIATGAEAWAGLRGEYGEPDCEVESSGEEVTCTFEGELPSYESIEAEVFVSLPGTPPDAIGGAPGQITVSGGDADAASIAQKVKVSSDPVSFGIERLSAQSEEEGGETARQAGGHPFQFTSTFQLNSGRMTAGLNRFDNTIEQPALPRNLRFPLPPGLVGNTTGLAQCPMADFLAHDPTRSVVFNNKCDSQAAIGAASVTFIVPGTVKFMREAVPVFNLPPAFGEPVRFGIMPGGDPVVIDTALDPDTHVITASVRNTTELAQLLSSTLSIWGYPGDPRHDSARGWECVFNLGRVTNGGVDFPLGPCERPAGLSDAALLRQPVQCASPLDFGAQIEPWNVPIGSQVASASFNGDPLLGCNKVPFNPSISAAPTGKLAESPSGLAFKLSMPNSGLRNPDAIAEGQPKKVEVTLPEGMTLNPSAAEGLATCSPAEYAKERFNSKPGEGCPEASKLGSVTVQTPLIEEPVKGALYQAAPHDNPFDSLLALYLVARVPERGILVKLAGRVDTNKQTGQIVTTFDNAPPLPFDSFDLSFREGGRAPLVTPPACGDYDIVARLTPWSAQDPNNPAPNEVLTRKSTFTVQRGVDGGACPSGGIPPFKPGFEAGSINNDAGAFSPFVMRLTRSDGEQDMTKFSTVLPPGVLGSLAGVGKCSDAAIAAAKGKSGKAEQASPSCPADSEIGRTTVGAGVGSVLTYIPGKVYLGGPYKGDPLSVIAITPAVAGPFDVGTVVVQEALNLNPKTAEVEVDGAASDPIPHILEGIPVKVRDLRVYVDRGNFILNPTSCAESSARATLFGSYLNVLDAGDDVPVDLSTRYQAANCLNLGFTPKLALKLKGGTRRGAHPGLKAIYTPKKGNANLKGLVVRLPSSAFLDQAHIRTICTRVQFAAKACPKAARYGYIKAWTPLLDEPLQGPVYLRSSNHKLPDLVFDLHGLVDVEVATRIDSVHGGIRATVEEAPDAPLTKVLLRMQGAKKGLIINSRNLCGRVNRANVRFAGQNGKTASAKPVMQPGCRGKRKHKRHHR